MALSKNMKIYIAGFAVIIVMCVVTLAAVDGEFGGSDDAGGEEADKYGYVPWTGDILTIITGDPDYELPGETESMLFAVQAAIGAIIIGYFIGVNSGKKKATAAKEAPAAHAEDCTCEECAPKAEEAECDCEECECGKHGDDCTCGKCVSKEAESEEEAQE